MVEWIGIRYVMPSFELSLAACKPVSTRSENSFDLMRKLDYMGNLITIIQIAIAFSFPVYFLLYEKEILYRIKNQYGIKESALERYRVMGKVVSYFSIFVVLLLVYSLF